MVFKGSMVYLLPHVASVSSVACPVGEGGGGLRFGLRVLELGLHPKP